MADSPFLPRVRVGRLVLSLRTSSKQTSAAEVVRKMLRNAGEGGGHQTKAGGFIKLANGSAAEITRLHDLLRRRYLQALKIKPTTRGQRLVGK